MTHVEVLALIARWMHILAAVIAIGGAFYARTVLTPAAEATLGRGEREQLREALVTRWRRVVHTCVLLFLASGFCNYLIITRVQHEGQPLYHALFGVKFLLALAVFSLAVGLTGRGRWSVGLRAKSRASLTALLILATTVILISGVLRSIPAAGI